MIKKYRSKTERIKELILQEKPQYWVFIFLSFAVAILSGILYFKDPSVFQRFLGSMNPLTTTFISIILGFVLLTFLLSSTKFLIYRKGNIKGLLIASAIALFFGFEIVVADVWIVSYPADINILFPDSLLFYPAIGYIAEIILHLLPLSLILLGLTSLFKELSYRKAVYISILAVAIAEPLYQVIAMGLSGGYSLTTLIYTGVHVFLISLSQLLIFKRYDFVSMYLFRLVFYAIWHILWGYLRLSLLF